MATLTGRDRGELAGLDLVAITDPADQRLAGEALANWAIDAVVPAALELRWRRPDGTSRWVLLTAGPLRGTHGTAVGLIQAVDISERKRLENRLLRQALHDPLTDLPNRLLLEDHLRQALARARRNGTRVAVLYLDLDQFKQVNDAFGHQVGDQVLVAMADRLRAGLREADIACRVGGDEFVIVCEGLEAAAAGDELVARLCRILAPPVQVGSRLMRLQASVGVAVGLGGETPAELIKRADQAMYAGKPGRPLPGMPIIVS